VKFLLLPPNVGFILTWPSPVNCLDRLHIHRRSTNKIRKNQGECVSSIAASAAVESAHCSASWMLKPDRQQHTIMFLSACSQSICKSCAPVSAHGIPSHRGYNRFLVRRMERKDASKLSVRDEDTAYINSMRRPHSRVSGAEHRVHSC